MFNAITSNFHWSEPSTLATLHDRPWTAIRMSITARKQGLCQVRQHVCWASGETTSSSFPNAGLEKTALLLLNKLTDSRAMDVTDAYLKLREQILAYNNPESETERTGGLNLINTTNLSFFDAKQKSELFRLKAIFLSSLRRTSKSNQAYCHSVQICPTYAKAWVSWGGLCSSLGNLTEKQLDQMAAKCGSTENSKVRQSLVPCPPLSAYLLTSSPPGSKETRSASSKKVAQYLAQAMGCYLEAIQIEAHEKSRIHLPKCLWVLTKDGSAAGVLCQTLENRGAKLPPWVWLPWVPQLLTGLCRIEGRAMKTILTCLVKAYPQAVYYSLRAFYLERRDVERAKGVTSSSSQHMASVAHAEEMMSTLRRSHASLWSSLEAILEELIVKFRPSYEEELLATISALLERAESHAEKQYLPDKKRLEDEDAMVASWSKTLSRIAAKFFRTSDASSSSNRRDERVKKTADFKRKYKEDFEADFKVSSSEGQSECASPDAKPQFRLSEYIIRLQRWKGKLETQVACTPMSLPLVESSHALAMFAGDVPDLWPGACDTKFMVTNGSNAEDDDDEVNRGQSSTSSSAAIARRAALTAALAAADAAANEGAGGEFGGGSATIEIPGQYCPNSSVSADIKPCPELHSKLVRFEPFVDVLRRNDQLVRRAGMVGSDGRAYRFLLQFAIPYWTRTDERTAQTHYIIDKFLRENFVAAKNHLSIQPSVAIPVAQRLRMTLDVDSRIALDDVWRVCSESNKTKGNLIPSLFLDEVAQKMNKVGPSASDDERNKKERAVRLEVYNDICKNRVDSRSLLRYVQTALDGPESLFCFRRAFSGQLAANSLLQYIFSVAERTPQRFVILQNTARILSPDFRVCYSNQGT
jgi:transformation/transcription domain-associated protein